MNINFFCLACPETEILYTASQAYCILTMTPSSSSAIYTAISFAPVQGFIEKSRKLRDLYGASLILSYLSQKIVEKVEDEQQLGPGSVISPALIDHQEGMPNRILVKGEVRREVIQTTLLTEWQKILRTCRQWVERNIGIPEDQYHWSLENPGGNPEWEHWGRYTWEIFMGWGRPDSQDPHKNLMKAAMDDLETRKLKRDWVAVNWVGESSSLSGTDAIAWHQLGKVRDPRDPVTDAEKQELIRFYRQLAWVLDDPYQRAKKVAPIDGEEEIEGKYIAANERLSVPELVKRLVTFPKLAKQIGMVELEEGFKDIYRDSGYWTGWFMGDGDQVGDKLKKLSERNPNNPQQQEQDLLNFSELMRGWGRDFSERKDLFAGGKCRVIYAGGDDFMGVLYSEEAEKDIKPQKLKSIEVWKWLLNLPKEWEGLQYTLAHDLGFNDENKNRFTYSLGFVWAGHKVPQRDILQHCREAEKKAKSLGRDRVTIRVIFNSGQHVEWTCPWDYLDILTKYRDRNHQDKPGLPEEQNWAHIYNDWAQLKTRHAIQLIATKNQKIDSYLAIAMLNLYFDDAGKKIQENPPTKRWKYVAGDNSDLAIIQWIDNLIQVGWYLCSNT